MLEPSKGEAAFQRSQRRAAPKVSCLDAHHIPRTASLSSIALDDNQTQRVFDGDGPNADDDGSFAGRIARFQRGSSSCPSGPCLSAGSAEESDGSEDAVLGDAGEKDAGESMPWLLGRSAAPGTPHGDHEAARGYGLVIEFSVSPRPVFLRSVSRQVPPKNPTEARMPCSATLERRTLRKACPGCWVERPRQGPPW